MIKVVAAMGTNRELGKDNALLWKLPNDLRMFKELTKGSVVVMGRKTFESIGRPLPGRTNIVITRNPDFQHEDVVIASSFEKAMELCYWNCFVIGGAEIYSVALERAEKLYLTYVDGDFDADTFFPEFGQEWVRVTDQHFGADESNEYGHTFVHFEKCKF